MPDCPSCSAEKPDSTRYCAPRACYCGHESCPAFASYIPRTKQFGVVRAAPSAAAFLAVILGANWLTNEHGLVTWLGLTATAGTWLAGFAFVARDALHEVGGRHWVLGAIAIGALLSAAMSPALALASVVAFTVSELADYAVYAPLRSRGLVRAAIASNVVGSLVDTVLFLLIAGFPLGGTATQVLIKVGVTTIFVLGVRLALPSKSLQPAGGGSHA